MHPRDGSTQVMLKLAVTLTGIKSSHMIYPAKTPHPALALVHNIATMLIAHKPIRTCLNMTSSFLRAIERDSHLQPCVHVLGGKGLLRARKKCGHVSIRTH